MSNNNTDTDTSMSNAVHSALQDAGSKAPAAAADESGTKRKRPKPSDATSSHVAVFHATAAGPQTAEQPTAGYHYYPAMPNTMMPSYWYGR